MSCWRPLTSFKNRSNSQNAGVSDPHLICIYIIFACYNIEAAIKMIFLKKVLLKYTPIAWKKKIVTGWKCWVTRGLQFYQKSSNMYVFTFYHVDTAIFAEHHSVFAHDLIYLLLLLFLTIVLEHMSSNNCFFSFYFMVMYF